MSMSESERQQLHALERELAADRRLVRLARRLPAVGTNTRVHRVVLLGAIGAAIGAFLILIGTGSQSETVSYLGLCILAGTMVAAGLTLLVVAVARHRRQQRIRDALIAQSRWRLLCRRGLSVPSASPTVRRHRRDPYRGGTSPLG